MSISIKRSFRSISFFVFALVFSFTIIFSTSTQISFAQGDEISKSKETDKSEGTDQAQLFLPALSSTQLSSSQQIQQTDDDSPTDNSNQSTSLQDRPKDDYYYAELARQRNEPRFVADENMVQAASMNNVGGRWSAAFSWPHVPVSAAQLPDGRILTWSSASALYWDTAGDSSVAATWNPDTGRFTNMNNPNHNMFCSHQSLLPDGRVFVNGGKSLNRTSIFDYRTNTWTRSQNMNNGRWYPTTVTLPSGKVFTALGSGGGGQYPEIWTENQGWDLQFGINLQTPILSYTSHTQQDWWPLLNVAPNGKIFQAGPTPRMHYIDTNGNGSVTPTGPFVNNWYHKHSGMVMYDEGKLLYAGGWVNGSNQNATNRAMTIDINNETPQVTEISPMRFARKFQNAVVMPNGEVLVVGGNTSGNVFSDLGSQLTPEIWNPDTGQWRTVSPISVPRNYHSIALLLPDGRVLSAGGGLCNCNADHPDAQLFTPPYLYNASGGLATRPNITNGPAIAAAGTQINIAATANMQEFSMIKMSSTTHANNTDLRYLAPSFTESSNGNYQINLSANINVLTPGHWMLFAIDSQGVPSVAKIIQITTSTDDLPEPPPTPVSTPVSTPAPTSVPVASPTPVSTPATSPVNSSETCAAEGTTRSSTTNNGAVAFDVVNETGRPIQLYWLDGSGQRTPYERIEVGQTLTGRTSFVGHPWLFADADTDECIYLLDTASDGQRLVLNADAPAAPLVVDPLLTEPKQADATIQYSASVSGGSGTLEYKWLFGDNTPETSYSTSSTASHSFAQPGRYIMLLSVRDESGQEETIQINQSIYNPLTANQPSRSSSVVLEESAGGDRLWNVNPDNDTVSVFNTDTNNKVAEIVVGDEPHSLAVAPDGRIWVINQESATISIIDPTSLNVVSTVSLGYGTKPYGIVFDPAGNNAFVTLEATGHLLKLNPTTGSEVRRADVGPNPRHLSVIEDGSKVYVTRFITPRLPGEETATVQIDNGGGEIVVVNAGSMTTSTTITLVIDNVGDAEERARGIPNYLGAPVISPDGLVAWIPSKEDNILRGGLRDGNSLNFEHTVRAISSHVTLATDSEALSSRIDHDNASLASAGSYGPYGNFLFIALETSREVAVIDGYLGIEIFRFDTGRAPQGLTLSADGLTLYVHNFMDRSIGVYDLTELINQGNEEISQIATYDAVANESLSNQVLNGKQIFYDARDTRLSRDAYMSCATCHNDGGQDGRIWDFTDRGEGLRNTITLEGHGASGQGRMHWSGNFDEAHDFEGQIRSLAGGTGLMDDGDFNATSDTLGTSKAGLSADLDALAAYLDSLTSFGKSPLRSSDGSLTTAGTAGRAVFVNNSCASCHGGDAYTDSATDTLHDIGTLKASSGQRLGGNLPGIDSPTLRGLWSTAPYLHDGSAANLADAVQAHDNVAINATELTQLVAFLNQIDDSEPAAALPPTATPVPPTATPPSEATVSTEMGDVSCSDGRNAVDALFTLQHDVNLREASAICTEPEQSTASLYAPVCDVNDDGRCNSVDALLTLQCDAGIENSTCNGIIVNNAGTQPSPINDQSLTPDNSDRVYAETILAGTANVAMVPIILEDAANISVASIEVRYDPDLLEVNECTMNDDDRFLMTVCNPEYALGVIRFNMVSMEGMSGDIKLADLKFGVRGTESENLYIDAVVTNATDAQGSSIELNVIDNSQNQTNGFSSRTFLPLIQYSAQ